MAIFDARTETRLKEELQTLTGKVKLVVFTQEIECQYCHENTQLAKDIASLSEKLDVELYNFILDKKKAEQYKVDKIPAIVIEGQKDYGVRFFGVPAGYELTSLLEAIKMVSRADSGLTDVSKEQLGKLDRSVHIQVFITPTCPYCPTAVKLAHKIAVESDWVTADMVEAVEFPHLAHKYNVFAVPKIIVNENIEFEGVLPESTFIEQVMKVMEENI